MQDNRWEFSVVPDGSEATRKRFGYPLKMDAHKSGRKRCKHASQWTEWNQFHTERRLITRHWNSKGKRQKCVCKVLQFESLRVCPLIDFFFFNSIPITILNHNYCLIVLALYAPVKHPRLRRFRSSRSNKKHASWNLDFRQECEKLNFSYTN